jgi:hypothetical protein
MVRYATFPSRHGALADERYGHRVGADAVARDTASGVGGVGQERRRRPMTALPNALIFDVAAILASRYTHTQLDALFARLHAVDDLPQVNKVLRVRAWLFHTNQDPTCDAVALLGGALEELMDREVPSHPDSANLRADAVRVLSRHGLTYRQGGIVLGATLSTPTRSVDELIRQRNLPELQKEFDRALGNVESDPPSAITAACAILESTFKVIIADRGLPMPGDQSILYLGSLCRSTFRCSPGRRQINMCARCSRVWRRSSTG